MAVRLHLGQSGHSARGRANLRGGDNPFFHGPVQGVAAFTLFVATWAWVTARSGMRDVTKKAQMLQLRGTAVKKRLDALTEVSGEAKGE